MDYQQKDAHTERGYSIRHGDSFAEQAGRAVFSLTGDEGATLGTQSQAPNTSRWDNKKKKFVRGDGTGADNQKLIKTESGKKLPASFKSGRFDEWAKSQRLGVQKVGEKEDTRVVQTARNLFDWRPGNSHNRGQSFVHRQVKPARRPDRFEDGFKQKMAKFKARTGEQESRPKPKGKPVKGKPSGGRRTGTKARSELKSANEIYKDRATQQKKKEKNARPSHKGRR